VTRLVVAIVLALAASAGADATKPLAVGVQAPPTALPDQHGRPFDLSEALRQRPFVVVAFYVKAFTGG
jgi:peroxiredoxin